MRRTCAIAGLAGLLVLRALSGTSAGRAADAPPPAATRGAPYLAGVPLTSLTATRDRPLFAPSRRAPLLAPAPNVFRPPPPAPVEEPLKLRLLGIIRAPEGMASAVVMDEADQTSLSLKAGDSRRGWIVRAIDGRTVTLQKQERTIKLTFQDPRPIKAAPAN